MKTKFNPWPLGIVFAFVIFIGIMTTAVFIACAHTDHLVSNNYYEQELKFQDQIESAARAEKSGATLAHDAAAGKIFIRLPTAQLAQKLSGTVELYRPSAPRTRPHARSNTASRWHANARCVATGRRRVGRARELERGREKLFSGAED